MQAELRGNQKENDLEIQGDQMVALLGAEATGPAGMKARSVRGLAGREREHSGLEEPSHRQPNPRGSSHPSARHTAAQMSFSTGTVSRGAAGNPTLMGSLSLSTGRAVTFCVIIVLACSLMRWQAFRRMG